MFNLSINIDPSGTVKPLVKIDKNFNISHEEIAILLFMLRDGQFYDLVKDKLKNKLSSKDSNAVDKIMLEFIKNKDMSPPSIDNINELEAAMMPIVDASKSI